MAFKQMIYSDFSGGYNDTSATISVDDNQTCISENVEYSAEVRGLQTRKGQSIYVSFPSYINKTLDAYSWEVGHETRTIVLAEEEVDLTVRTWAYVIKDGKITSAGRITNGATKIYPFVMYNTLYFGDGTELWEYGGYDTSFEAYVKNDKIYNKDGVIRYYNNPNFPDVTGTEGHFYKHITDSTKGKYTTIAEDTKFNSSTEWEDVTDVVGLSSSYLRKVQCPDVGKQEKMEITLTAMSATHTGVFEIQLVTPSGTTDSIAVNTSSSDTTLSGIATKIANAINNQASANWTAETSGSKITIESKSTGATTGSNITFYPSNSAYYIQSTLVTLREGRGNDANLDAIKKCTIFAVHNGSFRVFAAGNPNDTALFYSELGNPRYWKSDLNKVYPSINGYGSVTGIINLSDYLLVAYERGWFYWKGSTPLTDAYWKPMNIPYGCVSPRTLVLTPNSFTFLAKEGIYNVSVAILSDEYILLQTKQVIKKLSENVVEKTIDSIVSPQDCEGVFWHNAYLLSYWTIENGEKVQKVLKYEWDTASFTLITGWSPARFTVAEDKLLCASGRYVLDCFDSQYDIDTATGKNKKIKLHVRTKEYIFGSPLTDKIIQHLGLVFKQHTSKINSVRVGIRYGYNYAEYPLQNLAESFTWGRNWGLNWGWANTITKVLETILSGTSFQLELIDDRELSDEEVNATGDDRNATDSPVTLLAVGFIYEVTDYLNPTTYKDSELQK